MRQPNRPDFKMIVKFPNGNTLNVEVRARTFEEARDYSMKKTFAYVNGRVVRPTSVVAA